MRYLYMNLWKFKRKNRKMNEELEKQLYELGPTLYQEKDLPMTQTCMCWGFECPSSWFELLKELTNKLESINNKYKGKYECVAQQVKEKYGSLRFYSGIKILIENPTDDEIKLAYKIDEQFQEAVNDAENKSAKICCICGKPATKTSSGWIAHYCDDCAEKRNIFTKDYDDK